MSAAKLTSGVECPVCGEQVTCSYKCEHCGKPRPFSTDDGVGNGSQDGDR